MEASVVYVVLSLALVALLPLFVLALRASKSAGRINTATQLSMELLEEVRLRRWDESTPSPPKWISNPSAALGLDSGELPADKRTFDDVDDFNGWSESRPLDPVMQPVGGFEAYARTVSVAYVDILNPNAVSGTPTPLKRVTACTRWRTAPPQCLQSLLANR